MRTLRSHLFASIAFIGISSLRSLVPAQPAPSPCGGYVLGPEARANQDTTARNQVEPPVAVSPFYSLRSVAMGIDYRSDPNFPRVWHYTTPDGGMSWNESAFTNPLPPPIQGMNQQSLDPAIAWGGDPNRVYAVVNWVELWANRRFGSIWLYISIDGGVTWGAPLNISKSHMRFLDPNDTAHTYFEKPMISLYHDVDSNVDHAYVAFTQKYVNWGLPPTNYTDIRFTRSLDSGVVWTSPIVISDPPQPDHQWNAVPAVGPAGTIYVTWIQFPPPQGPACTGTIKIDVSTDFGTTFGVDRIVTSAYTVWPSSVNPPNVGRVWTHPVTKVRGSNVYIVYHERDATPSSPCVLGARGTEIRLVWSINAGVNWNGPVTINDDGLLEIDQFHPWMDIDPNGTLLIAWYDRRRSVSPLPLNRYYDVFYTTGSPPPGNFQANCRLTNMYSDATLITYPLPSGCCWIGEYLGVSASQDGCWVVAWADARNAPIPPNYQADVYFRRLCRTTDGLSSIQEISSSTGGMAVFEFDAGPEHAFRDYRIIGAANRTRGYRRGDTLVPLDRDDFHQFVEQQRSGPLFEGFEGILDSSGRARARWYIPPGYALRPGTYSFMMERSDGLFLSGLRVVELRQ